MTKINPQNLKRGDILLTHRKDGPKHTAIYCGEGQIVHASLNEKGGIYGGKTGDQTGREICTRAYYDKPWDYVLRYPDPVLANEYTAKAEAIAKDDTHGYDQINRQGPDFDCSSLVCYVVEAVGIPVRQKGASYTGNMKAAFLKCGFEIIDTNAPNESELPVAPPSASDDTIHIVKKGETLGAISRAYGVTVADIVKANPFIRDPNKIYIGDRLKVPKKSAPRIYSGKVKTNGGVLNIRAGKGTNYKKLGTLPNGSAVRLSSADGEWLKLADRDGYVCARYIVIG